MRALFYRILEGGDQPTPVMRITEILLITLISLNVIAAIAETVTPVQAEMATFLAWFEAVSIAIFLIEYMGRVWVCVEDPDLKGRPPGRARLRYMVSPLALIDLVAIAPAFLSLFIAVDLRWLRLFRLLRLFKLTRYWSALNLLYRVVRNEAEIIGAAVFLLCLVLVLASGCMYVVERDAQPEAFGSIPAAMWWTVATLTTVGYGDVVPVTIWGKVLGALIALVGIGIAAFPAGILAAGFIEQIRVNRRGGNDAGADRAAAGGTGTPHGTASGESRAVPVANAAGRKAGHADGIPRCPHCGKPLQER